MRKHIMDNIFHFQNHNEIRTSRSCTSSMSRIGSTCDVLDPHACNDGTLFGGTQKEIPTQVTQKVQTAQLTHRCTLIKVEREKEVCQKRKIDSPLTLHLVSGNSIVSDRYVLRYISKAKELVVCPSFHKLKCLVNHVTNPNCSQNLVQVTITPSKLYRKRFLDVLPPVVTVNGKVFFFF